MLLILLAVASCEDSGADANPDADHDGVHASKDCDDADPDVHPGADEIPYDGIDEDCDGEDLVDVDGDGHAAIQAGGDDCDDEEPTVQTPSFDIPYDGIDQDCDGKDNLDADGDGYDADGFGGDDCDDDNPNVHPGVLDDCYPGDEDCDGQKNEDADQDGDGKTVCQGDCDDLDPSVRPGLEDVPGNGIDEDCSGHDKGNCGDQAYDATHDLYAQSYGTNCTGIDSFQSVIRDERWHLPDWAMCVGSTASWDGSVSADGTSLDGHFTLELTSGCGSFSGSGSDDGVPCDDVTAQIGFWQTCL